MPTELSAKQPSLKAGQEKPESMTEQLQPDSKEAHERALDKTLADTFPASDPFSSIPDPSIPDAADEDPQAA